MFSLQALQESFRRSCLSGGDEGFASHLVGSEKLSVSERLAIYQNAYRSRLVEALAKDYPVIRQLLGEDAFSSLCHAYIAVYPSGSFSLRWLGRSMASFLASREDHSALMAELARFEWALIEAFDAADARVADEADGATIAIGAWPALKLSFHPSLRFVICRWNTLALWRAAQDKIPPPDPTALPQSITCIVWRDDLTTRYRTLDADEADALAAAAEGAPFASLCERLARWHEADEVPLRAASLLKRWLREGLVCDLGASEREGLFNAKPPG